MDLKSQSGKGRFLSLSHKRYPRRTCSACRRISRSAPQSAGVRSLATRAAARTAPVSACKTELPLERDRVHCGRYRTEAQIDTAAGPGNGRAFRSGIWPRETRVSPASHQVRASGQPPGAPSTADLSAPGAMRACPPRLQLITHSRTARGPVPCWPICGSSAVLRLLAGPVLIRRYRGRVADVNRRGPSGDALVRFVYPASELLQVGASASLLHSKR